MKVNFRALKICYFAALTRENRKSAAFQGAKVVSVNGIKAIKARRSNAGSLQR
jgi:hypothetical protein